MTKILLISFLFTLTVFSKDLPPKAGFSWWKIPALKGAMLVPDGWHKKETVREKTLAYFITKTKITDETPEYKIGLSVNVFKNFGKANDRDPLVFAKQYRKEVIGAGKVIQSWEKDRGPFKSIGFQVELAEKGKTFITHQLLIVTPKTGTLYLYLFEAPKADWNEAWKQGEQILKLLMIDDEI